MTLKEQIETDLISAMKAGDIITREVLRGLKSAISYWQIAQSKDAQDEDIFGLIKTAIKQRAESSEQYILAKRTELAEKEQKEAEILKKYLPEQLSIEEITKIVDQTVVKFDKDIKNMGVIMAEIKKSVGARADMGQVSSLVKTKLT